MSIGEAEKLTGISLSSGPKFSKPGIKGSAEKTSKYPGVSKAAQTSRVGSYELVFSIVTWLESIDLTIEETHLKFSFL